MKQGLFYIQLQMDLNRDQNCGCICRTAPFAGKKGQNEKIYFKKSTAADSNSAWTEYSDVSASVYFTWGSGTEKAGFHGSDDYG